MTVGRRKRTGAYASLKQLGAQAGIPVAPDKADPVAGVDGQARALEEWVFSEGLGYAV